MLSPIENRNLWLKDRLNELNAEIKKAKQNFIVVNLNSLIKGAENLDEIIEMLTLINLSLKNAGYTLHVSPMGETQIRWK